MNNIATAMAHVSPHDWAFSVIIPGAIALIFLLIQWLGPPSWTMFANGYQRARLRNIESKLAAVALAQTEPDYSRALLMSYVVDLLTSIVTQLAGLGLLAFAANTTSFHLLSQAYQYVGDIAIGWGTGRALNAGRWASLLADAGFRPKILTAKLEAVRVRLSKTSA